MCICIIIMYYCCIDCIEGKEQYMSLTAQCIPHRPSSSWAAAQQVFKVCTPSTSSLLYTPYLYSISISISIDGRNKQFIGESRRQNAKCKMQSAIKPSPVIHILTVRTCCAWHSHSITKLPLAIPLKIPLFGIYCCCT